MFYNGQKEKMKFLGNFDTKLDEKKFLKAKGKYGAENVILIGKHRFFLLRSILLLILGFCIFGVLIYITIKQYDDSNLLKMIFISSYSLLTGLWIILTFIKFFGYIRKEGRVVYDMDENALVAGKFEGFLKNSFILLVGQVVIGLANLVITLNIGTGVKDFLFSGLQGLLNVFFIFIVYRVLKDYIDFEMDYCLVTPLEIELVTQTGLLNRVSTVIDNDKIKSTTDNKKGLVRSLFNFGSIIILTEGDEEGRGEITLKFVPEPSLLKDKIRSITSNFEVENHKMGYEQYKHKDLDDIEEHQNKLKKEEEEKKGRE